MEYGTGQMADWRPVDETVFRTVPKATGIQAASAALSWRVSTALLPAPRSQILSRLLQGLPKLPTDRCNCNYAGIDTEQYKTNWGSKKTRAFWFSLGMSLGFRSLL